VDRAALSEGVLEKLRPVIARVVEGEGLELVDAVFRGRTLIVTIDRPGGVRVSDCQAVSSQLGVTLDVEDLIPFSYTLEVSSPGVDRPLVKPRDFSRAIGRVLRVTVRGGESEEYRVRGTLVESDENAIVLEVVGESKKGARRGPGELVRIPAGQIVEAKQDVVFRR